MGKVSKDLKARKVTQKNRRMKTTSCKYFDAGTLAQHGYANSPVPVPNSCTDLGKKRVAVLDFKDNEDQIMVDRRISDDSLTILSPMRTLDTGIVEVKLMRTPKTPCTGGRLSSSSPVLISHMKTPSIRNRLWNSPVVQTNLVRTPRTPSSIEGSYESRLESLPMDMLVKVLCHLHHDQLRPAFHVSRRIREAVVLARQFYFNFTTPDHSRQALLNSTTPCPSEHWPFVKNNSSMLKRCPKTPKAPTHINRPQPRIEFGDVCPIADVLFQESAFPSRYVIPSCLPRSASKSQLGSNRVLFFTEEIDSCNTSL